MSMTTMWNDETGEIATGHGMELASEPVTTLGVARAPADDSTLALMVRAAQGLQRDPKKLIERAKQIGGLLGASGFYRFPAGGSNVEGPSIDMAQALAQEWGGIAYQVRIVHAEPLASGGQRVHLRASVADMRSLVCAEVDQVVTTSAPPGKFADKPEQRERWNGMQVQSAASKIVRNAILRVIPAWYVEPAFESAKAIDSAKALGGKTLPEARKGAADALQLAHGCTLAELEAHLGQPFDMWAVPQISALRELFSQLKSGAQSVEAWRASLQEREQAATSQGPRRSALGLPAKSSATPVDDGALAAERAELERIKADLAQSKAEAKAKAAKAPDQGELVK